MRFITLCQQLGVQNISTHLCKCCFLWGMNKCTCKVQKEEKTRQKEKQAEGTSRQRVEQVQSSVYPQMVVETRPPMRGKQVLGWQVAHGWAMEASKAGPRGPGSCSTSPLGHLKWLLPLPRQPE